MPTIINWEWLSAISSNESFTQTFEVEATLTAKVPDLGETLCTNMNLPCPCVLQVNRFTRYNPNGCVAVFNVDYDGGSCPGKESFSRMKLLARLHSMLVIRIQRALI